MATNWQIGRECIFGISMYLMLGGYSRSGQRKNISTRSRKKSSRRWIKRKKESLDDKPSSLLNSFP